MIRGYGEIHNVPERGWHWGCAHCPDAEYVPGGGSAGSLFDLFSHLVTAHEFDRSIASSVKTHVKTISQKCSTSTLPEADLEYQLFVIERGYASAMDLPVYPFTYSGVPFGVVFDVTLFQPEGSEYVRRARRAREVEIRRLIDIDDRNECAWYRMYGSLCLGHAEY